MCRVCLCVVCSWLMCCLVWLCGMWRFIVKSFLLMVIGLSCCCSCCIGFRWWLVVLSVV